jgi:TonB family protein
VDARVWTVIVLTLCSAIVACRPNRPAQTRIAVSPALAAAAEPSPFDETPNSFVVAGPHFVSGETAIVRICVSTDGVISSANLIGSSGDKRFDDFAMVWARQVRLASRTQSAGTQTEPAKENCGAVRVEIREVGLPRGLSGADSSLG